MRQYFNLATGHNPMSISRPNFLRAETASLELAARPVEDVTRLLQAVRLGVRNHDAPSALHMIDALALASDGQAPMGRLLAAIVGVLQEESEFAAHQSLHSRQSTVIRIIRGVANAPGAATALADSLTTIVRILIAPAVSAADQFSAVSNDAKQDGLLPGAETAAHVRREAMERLGHDIRLRGEAAQCLVDILRSRAAPSVLPAGAVSQLLRLFLSVVTGARGEADETGSSLNTGLHSVSEEGGGAGDADGSTRKRPRLDLGVQAQAVAAVPQGELGSASRMQPSAHVFGALCGLRLLAAGAAGLDEAAVLSRGVSAAAAAWTLEPESPSQAPDSELADPVATVVASLWSPHCVQQARAVIDALNSVAPPDASLSSWPKQSARIDEHVLESTI